MKNKIKIIGIVAVMLLLMVSLAGATETEKWYVTGPSADKTLALALTRDGSAHNGGYTMASGNRYTFLESAPSLALGKDITLSSGTRINFSSYFDSGNRINAAYATWKLYKVYGSNYELICQKGDNSTGGVQLPDGTTDTITGYCTISSDISLNSTDNVDLRLYVWAETIGGGGPGTKDAFYYYDGTYESWVQYNYNESACKSVTISSLASVPDINTATITWTANRTADSRLKYSKNSDLSSSSWSNWENSTTSPSITLINIDNSTKYYYQAWSYNSDNNSCYVTDPTSSPYKNFTTLSISSWSKNRSILINNTCGSDQTYYQVNLNISYDSDMENDFDDIRVFNKTSGTTVPFFIVDKVDGNWCNIFFNATKVPGSVWTNTTYALYYNNSAVSSVSNIKTTFPFGDNFNNLGQWTDGVGGWYTSDGIALSTTVGAWMYPTTYVNTPYPNMSFGIRMKQSGSSFCVYPGWAGDIDQRLSFYLDNDNEVEIYDEVAHEYATDTTVYHIFRLNIETGANPKWELFMDHVSKLSGTAMYSVADPVSLKFYTYWDNANAFVDWVYFGKYIYPEPSALLGDEEGGPIDTTFTVSLPNGYTKPVFQPPNSTATNYPPNGQNSTQQFYQVTNSGNVNLDVRMQLNATVSTITFKADDDNNPTGASTIGTSLVTIHSGLTQGNSVNIWLWSDFDHTPEQTANKTMYINVSQS